MLFKKSFPVRIENEKLLTAKRGTFKQSVGENRYVLQKKEDVLFVAAAEPYAKNERTLVAANAKINVTEKGKGQYIADVELTQGIKVIFVFIPLLFLVFLTLLQLSPAFQFMSLFQIITLPVVFFILYRRSEKGVEELARRLQEDKSLFM